MRDSSRQELYKMKWKKTNGGGQLGEYFLEEVGLDLLRLANEDEVEPYKDYYIKDALNPNAYKHTVFNEQVEYSTILEFLKMKWIYVRKETKEDEQLKLL